MPGSEQEGRAAAKRYHAILHMDGIGCASCAYTIEHVGRKQAGVDDVRVHVGRGEIEVLYNGEDGPLQAIQGIVRRIGHEAEIRERNIVCGNAACSGEADK